ncbi:ABC transporter permease [Priestia megaterium]|uniref:FtsX-like permease family protein n=1 Tax=Priestia megaterium TaxID=1404 RepID=UPI000BEB35CA|nr:ABC transporter permease [Priestia megaterium]MDW4511716.1 ABC transporter permease [Priestia megaterium]PEC42078.1 hypothetical protein CON11_24970 [Priestia megaterium]
MTFNQLVCKNIFRNKRTYSAYFFSSSFSIMVFFMYALFAYHPAFSVDIIGGYVSLGLHFAEFIIYLFSIFFVLYSMGTFLKSRRKEFGILVINGMSHNQLRYLIFLENMIIGFFSIIFGVVGGLLIAKLLLLVGENTLGMRGQLSFYFPTKALILTFTAFLMLFFIISLFTTNFVKDNNLIDLLKGDSKPKPEPKSSITLCIISLLLLGVSYVTALISKEVLVIVVMVPVTIAVIIGTYLFFSQLNVFVLHQLRKIEKFYKNNINLIVISNLIYKMRDNARLFFIITIVLTVTFCSIGTLVGICSMIAQTDKINENGINIVLFIGFFIGAVFFISAGSFVYFRIYSDLEDEIKQYQYLTKLGLTSEELSRIVTFQLAAIFFVPIIVATIHGIVALTALQHLFNFNLARESILVLSSFIIIQVIYFTIMRYKHLITIKQRVE